MEKKKKKLCAYLYSTNTQIFQWLGKHMAMSLKSSTQLQSEQEKRNTLLATVVTIISTVEG